MSLDTPTDQPIAPGIIYDVIVVPHSWTVVSHFLFPTPRPSYSRGVMSPGRHVRTRLYFTSESHVHSLLNVFRYGGLLDVRQSV